VQWGNIVRCRFRRAAAAQLQCPDDMRMYSGGSDEDKQSNARTQQPHCCNIRPGENARDTQIAVSGQTSSRE
jgi:hypothetical protein